jgi:hypothetical protein
VKVLAICAIILFVWAQLSGTHMHISDSDMYAGVYGVHIHDSEHHADEADWSVGNFLPLIEMLTVFLSTSILAILLLSFSGNNKPVTTFERQIPENPLYVLPRLRAPPQIR